MTPVVHTRAVSAAFDAGMVLAAALAGDADGARAADGLAPELAARLVRRSRAFLERKRESRTAALLERGSEMRAAASPSAAEPRRVLAVLAGDVERTRGDVWLAAVPGHRTGWSAPADLRALLVRRTRHDAAERADRQVAELEECAWPAS